MTSSNVQQLEPLTLKTALRYAAMGWPVLPLVPNRKVPATAHGVHDGLWSLRGPRVHFLWLTRNNVNDLLGGLLHGESPSDGRVGFRGGRRRAPPPR